MNIGCIFHLERPDGAENKNKKTSLFAVAARRLLARFPGACIEQC
jgi:hypothetical protein